MSNTSTNTVCEMLKIQFAASLKLPEINFRRLNFILLNYYLLDVYI